MILLGLLLVGCGRPVTVRQNQPVAGLAPSGGNLIMALGARDPATLDPALVGDATSAFVTQQLFSGLVRLDENLAIQPGIAERWTVSDDGMTYTFILRANARFADGTPITSEDVRYSLERATDPGRAATLPARVYLNDIVGVAEKLDGTATSISGIQVIDPQTLAITIVGPRSYFLAKLSHPTAFVVDRRTEEADPAGWTEQPNGSGPFMIEEWRHDQRLVLRRNLNYYGDLARLDRVTMLMGAAASNPLVLYETGAIDFTSVPAYALDRVRDESNPLSRELVSVPQLSLSYIGMNVNRAPFDDVNVRQAFTLLIDQARLANVTLSGGVQAARGILPPGMPGYNEQLPDPQVDLKRARQLLRESSYGGAEQLPPIVGYGGGWVGLLRDLAEEELGVMIEVRAYENFGDYLDALDEAQFALFDIGWVADYPDPQNFLDVLFRSGSQENYSAYASPEVDALLDQAASEADEMTRWQLYQEAERQILADAPIIPLYHNIDYVLIKPYVHGLNVTPMGILDLSTAELIR
jgi:ABC-type transport system substrate-binding protein